MSRTLFVLKYRENPESEYSGDYSGYSDNSLWGEKAKKGVPLSSGLFNSASFVVNNLIAHGIEAKLVSVIDNNYIHREIAAYSDFANNNPVDTVIIEAYWVVATKLPELFSACPYVKRWIVRNHSEAPFLAMEGMAFDWTMQYAELGVAISCNSPRMTREVRVLLKTAHPEWTHDYIISLTPYLPNYYPIDDLPKFPHKVEDKFLDVGCFGAVRPLKATMTQALAAIEYAARIDKNLRFHTNLGRIEGGSPIVKNLNCLFSHLPQCELISHGWTPHEEFTKLVASMDINMSVSFSETYSIYGADSVSQKVPLVVSNEVPWSNHWFNADPTNTESMVRKIGLALWFGRNVPFWQPHEGGLRRYNRRSTRIWLNFINMLD